MILSLLIIAGVFFVLAVWFLIKSKKVLGFTFMLISFTAVLLFVIVRALYPHKIPF